MSKDAIAVDAEQFMTRWRDLLPEKWDDEVQVNLLNPNRYRLEAGVDGVKSIRWVGDDPNREVVVVGKERDGLGSSAKDIKPVGGAAGKRRWHEKFKDSRNAEK
jgi:hypothetical protein